MGQIHYTTSDIFASNAQVIVNPVNCCGVMFAAYVQECRSGQLRIGRPTLYRASQPWILNFPTKDHWRNPAKLEYIEQGLQFFAANYHQMGITSIAFPKLGAGLGKLSWDNIRPLMVNYLEPLECEVTIYGEPNQ